MNQNQSFDLCVFYKSITGLLTSRTESLEKHIMRDNKRLQTLFLRTCIHWHLFSWNVKARDVLGNWKCQLTCSYHTDKLCLNVYPQEPQTLLRRLPWGCQGLTASHGRLCLPNHSKFIYLILLALLQSIHSSPAWLSLKDEVWVMHKVIRLTFIEYLLCPRHCAMY